MTERNSRRPATPDIIVALPLAALAAGLAINYSLVPSAYEWTGLIRICGDLFKRPGFWCIALMLWTAGVGNAGDGFSWQKLFAQRNFAISWAAATALVSAIFAVTVAATDSIAGSIVDFFCFALLVSGFAVVATFRAGHVRSGIRVLSHDLLVGCGIFAGYSAVSYFHTMAKGLLFVVAPPQDALLWTADSVLLGEDYYQHLMNWRRTHPSIVEWLDIVYIGLLQQICWAALFFYGAHDKLGGRQYILAMFLINTLGSLSYFVVPSMGPIFHAPEAFTELNVLAPDTWELSRYLLSNTNAAAAGITHEIAPFGYIAALPSVHVGIAIIMLLAMRRSRAASILNIGLITFTVAATNILGWHYSTDIVAGLMLGVACWFAAIRLSPSP